jgi:prolyl-tRNA synthetase
MKKTNFNMHGLLQGLSTRFIGAIIMVHGTIKGLILPPSVSSPIQIIIVPIWSNPTEKSIVMDKSQELMETLQITILE